MLPANLRFSAIRPSRWITRWITLWIARWIARVALYALLLLSALYIISPNVFSGPYNGFEIHSPLIPLTEIHHGGPARDGIPSIDRPKFISAAQAGYLHDNDRVLGVVYRQQAKAYPIRLLNWHEIVNDKSLLITYCPLCGTGMVFETRGRFGVSGLLYNSDMLLYDRQSESLWSQIMAQAISGPRKGERLKLLSSQHTSWQHWREQYPQTQVLSVDTGFSRDYSHSPYGNYASSEALYFSVSPRNRRYHPKERVLGVQINQQFKAYPFVELSKTGQTVIDDRFAGQKIQVIFNPQHRSATVKDQRGKPLPSVTGYWFAWYAFHPQTQVFQAR